MRTISLISALLGLAVSDAVWGADLKTATVTQVVRDVKVVAGENVRPAEVGDDILGRTAVSTGSRSLAELEFNDRTLLRLGSNTTFSLSSGSRTIDLKKGSVLLQTAPGSGGVNIRAGSVTAAITGSLGFFSVSDPTDPDLAGKELIVKLISIHGGIGLIAGGKTYDLEPFQILVARIDLEGNLIGEPEIRTLDGARVLATSRLVNGFPGNDKIDDADILAQLDVQGGEKDRNQWTSTNSYLDLRTDLPDQQTTGLNALIRRFLPKPKVITQTPVVTAPDNPVVRFFPKPKGKGKGKGNNRPKPKPKPKPKPQPMNPYPTGTTNYFIEGKRRG